MKKLMVTTVLVGLTFSLTGCSDSSETSRTVIRTAAAQPSALSVASAPATTTSTGEDLFDDGPQAPTSTDGTTQNIVNRTVVNVRLNNRVVRPRVVRSRVVRSRVVHSRVVRSRVVRSRVVVRDRPVNGFVAARPEQTRGVVLAANDSQSLNAE